MTSSCYF